MKQEKKAPSGSEKKNELVQTGSKTESLAEMIVRTAKPVDLTKFRLTNEDLQKVRMFVETSVREQFEAYVDGPRSFFDFDQKAFKGQLEAFVMDKDGLNGNEFKGKQAKKLAKALASKWVNYFKYSEFRATWTQSYLEFKQSFR